VEDGDRQTHREREREREMGKESTYEEDVDHLTENYTRNPSNGDLSKYSPVDYLPYNPKTKREKVCEK
jgi:hypothetical protein